MTHISETYIVVDGMCVICSNHEFGVMLISHGSWTFEAAIFVKRLFLYELSMYTYSRHIVKLIVIHCLG